MEDENKLYSSAKISLNLHEQNKVIGLNGRTFRIPACGGYQICDYVSEIYDFFRPDEIIMVKTDADFFEAIEYYLLHNEERELIQKKPMIASGMNICITIELFKSFCFIKKL
ncbi:MAG: glycosyltransferase family 1 protein [Candidatus Staskawiczbacteria bacterium]|nr:glycosyltransferase family 1 protein [Candidatus Staskawiczbacteria bacterium]